MWEVQLTLEQFADFQVTQRERHVTPLPPIKTTDADIVRYADGNRVLITDQGGGTTYTHFKPGEQIPIPQIGQ
ncbi:MAG: hypothetical protein J4432_03675 [DPANN group archaeon]|nr:hypothetical protein [DPANN group archaeon]